jgi:hypothetical protein
VRDTTGTCLTCGGKLTCYWTHERSKGKYLYRKRILVCRPCFNRYRRNLYRKRHPKREPQNPWRLGKDYYARGLLSQGTGVAPSAWPAWLVALKRQQLQFRRLCLNHL